MIDQSTATATIQSYVECCRQGNVEGLKQIFHEQAAMYGYLQGELVAGTPEMFFEAVASAPSPTESGEPYQAELDCAEATDQTATVILKESNYWGLSFTNSFQLLQTEGKWFIVSKLFHSL